MFNRLVEEACQRGGVINVASPLEFGAVIDPADMRQRILKSFNA